MLYGSKMWCLKENKLAVFEKSGKTYGEGNVQCKVGGQEEYRGPDGHVGIERSSR